DGLAVAILDDDSGHDQPRGRPEGRRRLLSLWLLLCRPRRDDAEGSTYHCHENTKTRNTRCCPNFVLSCFRGSARPFDRVLTHRSESQTHTAANLPHVVGAIGQPELRAGDE